jgi:CheY-like chemotaxis protein
LHKPVRRTQLLDALQTVLSKPPMGLTAGLPTSESTAPQTQPQATPVTPQAPATDNQHSTTAPAEDAHLTADKAPVATRTLVVEDNPINALVVRAMLKRLGYQSEHAGTGVEAVQALQRQSYDLVFMDMQMPEMDGPEATRLIRKLTLDKQPYIVAFTANVMAEDRAACREAGMDAFIGKPVRVADMQACLADYNRHAGITTPPTSDVLSTPRLQGHAKASRDSSDQGIAENTVF